MEWHWASPILTLLIAAITIAYNEGSLRQRVSAVERRQDGADGTRKEDTRLLQEIRDKVVALDEWRKMSVQGHHSKS